MTDIHCHILPDVDDGSPDIHTSLMMAAMAADDGVRAIIATPHFYSPPEEAEARQAELERAYAVLKERLEQSGMPVDLYLGAEVLCNSETIRLLDTGAFPTLNGSGHALVEFYFDESESVMNGYLEAIAAHGTTPIIAHPERYAAVQKNTALPARWGERGYMLQINSGSLKGIFGRKAQRTAKRMLENETVHFIASDAHDLSTRSTVLSDVYGMVAASCGEAIASRLMRTNFEVLVMGTETAGK